MSLAAHYIDLNCDVGEGVGNEAALFPHISSCNIACGGHAGDASSIVHTATLAAQHGVKVGAHPSYPDREHFGRVSLAMEANAFRESMEEQLAGMANLLNSVEIPMHHVKAHGALYNDLAGGGPLALPYLEVLQNFSPGVLVFAPCRSRFARMARDRGFQVWEEAFADRAYKSDGSLASRKRPGAVLTDPGAVSRQVREMVLRDRVRCVDGTYFHLKPNTYCLHGDTPMAEEILTFLIKSLGRESIHIRK